MNKYEEAMELLNQSHESLYPLVTLHDGTGISAEVAIKLNKLKPIFQELVDRATPIKAKFIAQGSQSFKYECKCGFQGWHRNVELEVTFCEKCGQAFNWNYE